MLDPASVKGVVEDAPDRSGGKQSGFGYRITLARIQLMAIAGSESLGVETGSQLGKGGQTGGVPVEQLLDCRAFFMVDVKLSRMLRVADAPPLPIYLYPAGLIAKGDGAQM